MPLVASEKPDQLNDIWPSPAEAERAPFDGAVASMTIESEYGDAFELPAPSLYHT